MWDKVCLFTVDWRLVLSYMFRYVRKALLKSRKLYLALEYKNPSSVWGLKRKLKHNDQHLARLEELIQMVILKMHFYSILAQLMVSFCLPLNSTIFPRSSWFADMKQNTMPSLLPDYFLISVETFKDEDVDPWITGEERNSDRFASYWERSIWNRTRGRSSIMEPR